MAKRLPKTDWERKNEEQLKKASMALDDLVWTLQQLKVDQLSRAAEVLRFSLDRDSHGFSVGHGRAGEKNKRFLIGTLPRLFQDRALFPQNEDIVDFAASALHLAMSRTEKRSRYEIIGKVVCETDLLDESELTMLVKALDALMADKEKLAQMAERKRAGSFSWNETLQELLKG